MFGTSGMNSLIKTGGAVLTVLLVVPALFKLLMVTIDEGEAAVPVIIRTVGGVKQISRGDWKTGENSQMTVTVNCNIYQEVINGETVVDIDVLHFVRIIGGIDQLADVRAALGA